MKKKKRMKNMTKFVILAIIHIDIFTLVCIIANFLDKQIQDEVVTGLYSAFTGELAGMLLKKLIEGRKKKSEEGEGDIE